MESLRQWLDGDSFTREAELTFADCDRDKNVRPATLLSLVATVPSFDYDARGLPYDRLYALRQVFLLSRVSLRIHRRPRFGEVLAVTTWEDGAHGAHMRRVYEMADRAGKLLVSARSEWILVDPVTRKILRPSSFTGKAFTNCPKAIDCPACQKIPLPREGAEDLGLRPVRWTDLDGNGHVYSGKYGDIAWDALPPDLQGAPLRGFAVDYSREATLGDALALRGLRDGETYTLEGRVGGEHRFSCRAEFEIEGPRDDAG